MAYVEMIRIRFLTMLAYRLNYFSGILTYIVYTDCPPEGARVTLIQANKRTLECEALTIG